MTREQQQMRMYQVRVSLSGAQLPIWRRLLVSERLTLLELHRVLQAAMGWTDSHLHEFVIGETVFSDPEFELEGDFVDEKTMRLRDIPQHQRSFLYEYDFGDDWRHDVTIEETMATDAVTAPVCIDGQGHCPREDFGGIDLYNELVEMLSDEDRFKRAEARKQLGPRFDPARFDIDAANRAIRRTQLEILR